MSLALPALVILLGLLPGICSFYGYFAGRFDKRTAGVSGVEELALYIVLAIPIDALSLRLLESVGVHLDFDSIALILLGGPVVEEQMSLLARDFSQSYWLSAKTYFILLIASYAFGSIARRFVWTFRLDVWVPILRVKHEWFYVLQGRLPRNPRNVLARVDVLAAHPEGSRLYRGLVVDFRIGGDGAIHSLTLRETLRGSGRGRYFKWKTIPSNTLSIMGSMIHSINVTYYAVENMPKPKWVIFRRFFLEEA